MVEEAKKNAGENARTPVPAAMEESVKAITESITEKITEAEIWPGGAAGISLPCIAPLYPGTYTMSWHVEDTNGSSVFSPLTITINAVDGVLTPTPGPTPDGYIEPTVPPDIYIAQ